MDQILEKLLLAHIYRSYMISKIKIIWPSLKFFVLFWAGSNLFPVFTVMTGRLLFLNSYFFSDGIVKRQLLQSSLSRQACYVKTSGPEQYFI
jgi:hypothetical protein